MLYDCSILLPISSTVFLNETLRSIENQKMGPYKFELVIILDRISRDEVHLPKALIEQTVFTAASKPGLVEALNQGILVARSNLIARIDGDDIMLEDRLRKQIDVLRKRRKLAICGSQAIYIDKDGFILGKTDLPLRHRRIKREMVFRNVFVHPSVMFRKEVAIKVGGYRSYFAEDWDLWRRILENHKGKNTRHPLIRYRQHNNQMSREDFFNETINRRRLFLSETLRSLSLKDIPSAGESTEVWEQRVAVQMSNNVEFRKFESINGIREDLAFLYQNRKTLGLRHFISSSNKLFVDNPKLFIQLLFSRLLRRIRSGFF